MVQRIEQAFAVLGSRFADAGVHLGAGAAKQAVGSGWATFLGTGSPLTHAVGADGQLSREHLQALEDFFFTRGADAIIEVADIWQLENWLTSQGYEMAGSEQVLECDALRGTRQAEVADCANRLDDWATAVQLGFGMEPTPGGHLLGRILASETALGILRDGQLAASAGYAVVDDAGYCFADSTLAAFRGQGLQQQLIRHRLWLTAEAGARYCVAETVPGSGSQRNYARCGFVPVFLRQTWVKRCPV